MALLPSDPTQQKKLLLGLLPLALLFAYWYFFHGKKTDEIAVLETRLEQLESKNDAARARARAGGPELEKRLALFEQHITRLEELVPSSEDLPDLLHAMTMRAQEHRVDLAKLEPEDPQPGPYYTLQAYQMVVIGNYHDVGRFLAAVASLPRIVTPVDVTVEPRRGSTEDEAVQVQTRFRIKTYVLPAPEVVPVGEEARPNAST